MMDYLASNYRKYSLCEHISTFIMLIATSQLTYTITNDINNINIKTEQFDDNKSCDVFITSGGGIVSCRDYLYIIDINKTGDSVTNNIIGIDLSPSIYLWNSLYFELYDKNNNKYYQCEKSFADDSSPDLQMFIYSYNFNKNGIIYSIGTSFSTRQWIYIYINASIDGLIGDSLSKREKNSWIIIGDQSVSEHLELFYAHFNILQTDFNSNRHYYLACLYSYILSNNTLNCNTNNIIGIGLSASIYLWNELNDEINVLKEYYICIIKYNRNSQYIAIGTSENIITLYADSSISANSNIRNHDTKKELKSFCTSIGLRLLQQLKLLTSVLVFALFIPIPIVITSFIQEKLGHNKLYTQYDKEKNQTASIIKQFSYKNLKARKFFYFHIIICIIIGIAATGMMNKIVNMLYLMLLFDKKII